MSLPELLDLEPAESTPILYRISDVKTSQNFLNQKIPTIRNRRKLTYYIVRLADVDIVHYASPLATVAAALVLFARDDVNG